MFKSSFILNNIVFDKNKEDFEYYLTNLAITGNMESVIMIMKNNTDWMEQFNENTLKKIILSLSRIEKSLEIDIEGWPDCQFSYDNLMKKFFFLHNSKLLKHKPNARIIMNTFLAVEKSEITNHKCFAEFTDEETHQSIIDMMGVFRYFMLRQRIVILSNFQAFYKEKYTLTANWKKALSPRALEKIINPEFKEISLISNEELLHFSKLIGNMQVSVIFLLIFNGVKLSKYSNKDEVRYLKKMNLSKNNLTIIDKNGPNSRTICLEKDIAKIIREASKQEQMVEERKGINKTFPLKDTEYVLRVTLPVKYKSVEEEEDIMPFRAAWARIMICREHMHSLAPDFPFTVKDIEQSGKVYFINKFIAEEDLDVYDAIRETLKRFGDWSYLENGNEISYPPNTQRVNRLKHFWSIYN